MHLCRPMYVCYCEQICAVCCVAPPPHPCNAQFITLPLHLSANAQTCQSCLPFAQTCGLKAGLPRLPLLVHRGTSQAACCEGLVYLGYLSFLKSGKFIEKTADFLCYVKLRNIMQGFPICFQPTNRHTVFVQVNI